MLTLAAVAEPSTLSLVREPDTEDGAQVTRPQLFLVLEAARPLAPSARISLADVDLVTIGRGNERSIERTQEGRARRVSIKVPDRWMSSNHVKLTRVQGQWVAEDEGSKNGTLLNGAALQRKVLEERDLLELGQTFFLFRESAQVEREDPPVQEASDLAAPTPELQSFFGPLRRAVAALARAATAPLSVVVTGESGTGKEVIARALHQLSQRSGAFVAVNCGALPETLIEAELFGAKKGSHSAAFEDRPGLVRAADRGTLFLDEIGDLPLPSQVAFLRVLQQREVVSLGETKPVKVDFRLVAATHRDLDKLVGQGRFRQDLFSRITGLAVRLPPLRDRREDLGILISALLVRVAGEAADRVSFSAKAARALLLHDWPLNVRELEKALEAAVALSAGSVVEIEHLPESVRSPDTVRPPPAPEDDEPLSAEDEQIKQELVALLEQHGGNISAVARAMGKARMQIHRWIRRFRVDHEQFRR